MKRFSVVVLCAFLLFSSVAYAAVAVPRGYGERLPADWRVYESIGESPTMLAEQGGEGFLAEWGGSEGYKAWAQEDGDARAVFFAAKNHAPEDVASVVGLSAEKVSKAVDRLERIGKLDARFAVLKVMK